MPIGIYKQGQGYWVRVLTAVGIGMVLLACAGWVWNQAKLVSIPTGAWRLMLLDTRGATAVGARLEAVGQDPVRGERVPFGEVVVRSFERAEAGGVLTIEPPPLAEGLSPSMIVSLSGEGEFEASVRAAFAVPVIEPLYVQGAAVAVVLLIGLWLIYWVVGRNPRTSEFLIATDGEMKKVNWSTRREVIGSTWVVIVASFIIAAFLFGIDQIFSHFFQMVGVLER